MTFGIPISVITWAHVVISLVAIATGFIVFAGLFLGRRLEPWTFLFLATSVATGLSGYLFPFEKLLPSHIMGVLLLAASAAAIAALYRFRLLGSWRAVFVVCSAIALYLNCFVGVVQAFQKIGFLRESAPTQTEAPFVVSQLALLLLLAAVGVLANLNSRRALAGSHS